MKALVIHGPNLNLLGGREPGIYGTRTLEEINGELREWASLHESAIDIVQSNHEGEIIDRLQQANGGYDAVVINPGAYTHYSYAIRDAIASTGMPVIEVHLSNIFSREEFRTHSVTAPACRACICGMGYYSYVLGLTAARHLLQPQGSAGGG